MAKYLKIPEVAQRLDVSEKTARRYVKAGEVPSTFIGGAYRVSEEDLEQYLEGARVEAPVTPGKVGGPGKAEAPTQLEEPERGTGKSEERVVTGAVAPLGGSVEINIVKALQRVERGESTAAEEIEKLRSA